MNLLVDVRVTNSLLNMTQARKVQFHNGSLAEKEKVRKYSTEPEIVNGQYAFQPFVIETMGGFGWNALDVIQKIARNLATNSLSAVAEAQTSIRHQISAVLARYNADMLLEGL